jgi:hypothetical protein
MTPGEIAKLIVVLFVGICVLWCLQKGIEQELNERKK